MVTVYHRYKSQNNTMRDAVAVLAGLVTFAIYLAMGNHLTPEVAFYLMGLLSVMVRGQSVPKCPFDSRELQEIRILQSAANRSELLPLLVVP